MFPKDAEEAKQFLTYVRDSTTVCCRTLCELTGAPQVKCSKSQIAWSIKNRERLGTSVMF